MLTNYGYSDYELRENIVELLLAIATTAETYSNKNNHQCGFFLCQVE